MARPMAGRACTIAIRREDTGASELRAPAEMSTPSAPARAASHRMIARIAASSQPLPWSVYCVACFRSTGWLTVVASASCWEVVYVGLSFAPLARPLLSDCAPLLAELALELRLALPDASDVAPDDASWVPPASVPVALLTVLAPDATDRAPVDSFPALPLSRPLALSSCCAPRAMPRSPSASAPAPAATVVLARATPSVARANTRAAPAWATARSRERSRAWQKPTDPPAAEHCWLRSRRPSARVPVPVDSRDAPSATTWAPLATCRVRPAKSVALPASAPLLRASLAAPPWRVRAP